MNVEIRPAFESEKLQIEKMLDRYLEELGSFRDDPESAWSAAEYPYLKLYWTETVRFPFTVWVNGELAGFVLCRRIETNQKTTMEVAEFFIQREFRRRGVGTIAATAIWEKFPGHWELQVLRRNRPGLEFWSQCIRMHASAWHREEIAGDGGRRVVFRFETGKGLNQSNSAQRRSAEEDPSITQVAAGLLSREGRLLICQRSARGRFPNKWEFPGGKIEKGEEPREALRRELQEELGIIAEIGREVWRTDHQYAGYPPVRLLFFSVENYSGVPENRVFQQILWANLRDLTCYDFLEADRPLIEQLQSGALSLPA